VDLAAARGARRDDPRVGPRRRPMTLLRVVRYGLPAGLVLAGFVLLIAAPDSTRYEGFAMCVGAGLALFLLNWLFRLGATGDKEREQEDAAREYLAEHGRWPDDKRHQ
jgi:hypothetical protein